MKLLAQAKPEYALTLTFVACICFGVVDLIANFLLSVFEQLVGMFP